MFIHSFIHLLIHSFNSFHHLFTLMHLASILSRPYYALSVGLVLRTQPTELTSYLGDMIGGEINVHFVPLGERWRGKESRGAG